VILPIDWAEQLSVHRRWLETVVRCRLGDSHDTDDILQDVALVVMPHPNRPTEIEKVAPWLYRVTLRKVINLRRTLGRRRRMIEGLASKVAIRERTIDEQDAPSWLMKQECRESIRDAMKQLPGDDQEILTLKYTEDWTYQQLANHLGVSIKTVEYRLLRARASLTKQLGEWTNE